MGGINIERVLDVIGNYYFPLVLSAYLIYRIDNFLTQMVTNQKEFQTLVIMEIKDIKEDIHSLHLDMAKNISRNTPGL